MKIEETGRSFGHALKAALFASGVSLVALAAPALAQDQAAAPAAAEAEGQIEQPAIVITGQGGQV